MGEYGDVAAYRDFEESFQIEQEKNSSWMRPPPDAALEGQVPQ